MRMSRRLSSSVGLLCTLIVLSSCSLLSQSDSASPSNSTSVSPTATVTPSESPTDPAVSPSASPTAPELTASASQIDCQDGQAHIVWQANHTLGNVAMKIADLQCESGGPQFGQVIETFSLENGKWISQGLASGPDLSFRTVGECIDDLVNSISCPAQALSEDGSKLEGNLSIALTDKNATWQFAVKD